MRSSARSSSATSLFRLVDRAKRSAYFFRQFGWADLLASLPFPQLKILRIFRLYACTG